MSVEELMTRELISCSQNDSLQEAARRMWDGDCGFALVNDEASGDLRGVVTDRDVCMAALTKGVSLAEIPVDAVMRQGLATCTPDDDLSTVHALMREHQIRRIPVVDGGKAVGVISLNDLAIDSAQQKGKEEARALKDVAVTLGAICRHGQPVRA